MLHSQRTRIIPKTPADLVPHLERVAEGTPPVFGRMMGLIHMRWVLSRHS